MFGKIIEKGIENDTKIQQKTIEKVRQNQDAKIKAKSIPKSLEKNRKWRAIWLPKSSKIIKNQQK